MIYFCTDCTEQYQEDTFECVKCGSRSIVQMEQNEVVRYINLKGERQCIKCNCVSSVEMKNRISKWVGLLIIFSIFTVIPMYLLLGLYMDRIPFFFILSPLIILLSISALIPRVKYYICPKCNFVNMNYSTGKSAQQDDAPEPASPAR